MKITINGDEYELNTEAAKCAGYLKLIDPITLGSLFRIRDCFYALVQVKAQEIIAVNIDSGNRFSDKSTGVVDTKNITAEEIAHVFRSSAIPPQRVVGKLSDILSVWRSQNNS